jgi:hypothetical protein
VTEVWSFHDSAGARSTGIPVLVLGWIDRAGIRRRYPRGHRRRLREIVRTIIPATIIEKPSCTWPFRSNSRAWGSPNRAGHDSRTCPLCLGGGHPITVRENQQKCESQVETPHELERARAAFHRREAERRDAIATKEREAVLEQERKKRDDEKRERDAREFLSREAERVLKEREEREAAKKRELEAQASRTRWIH